MQRSRVVSAGAVPVPPAADGRGLCVPSSRGKRRRAPVKTLVLAALLAAAAPIQAQRPGEIAGVVIDAATSAPINGADILLPALQRATITDAAGRFRIRGVEPGEWTLSIARIGFAAREAVVIVRNGQTARLIVRLAPEPVALPGVIAALPSAPETVPGNPGDVAVQGFRIDRTAIEAAGARTAGDALRAVPGVVIRSMGQGAAQQASLRGMAPDAVLVLVDGVPLNDAVTGEADLSTVDASSISTITVLPGAQSARWGPRAAAGVILIETQRGGGSERRFSLTAGSLGVRDATIAWGGGWSTAWNAGVSLRTQDGRFDFELPAAAGGGTGSRYNADLRTMAAHTGLRTGLAGGWLRARAGVDALERGLPGRAYAPSRDARQTSERGRVSLAWRRAGTQTAYSTLLAGSHERLTGSDSDPPFGLPYADTTGVTYLEARAEVEHTSGAGRSLGAGFELRRERIAGNVLGADAPETRVDGGAFAHGALSLAAMAGTPLRLAAQARIDRDPVAGGAIASHSLTLSWSRESAGVHVAHRSSYSPPAPGDRFFREAIGTEPNLDLAAERVRGEIEITAHARAELRRWVTSARAAAYRGDIDGMIIWSPDFRFIWSPKNQDVRRTGAEVGLVVESPGGFAQLDAAWTYVRATYDRGDEDNDVQIAYRPRSSATLRAAVQPGHTRLDLTARYIGTRTTAASTFNMLSGFWTLDAGLSQQLSVGTWSAVLDVRIERVFDEDDALIFGFPEPGRVVRVGIRLAPAELPTLLSIGDRQ